ncbi:MAG TPA: hypothetical protein VGJ20_16270 [Xanthobacteraceae bacterium]|jgi:hypothetical protein
MVAGCATLGMLILSATSPPPNIMTETTDDELQKLLDETRRARRNTEIQLLSS